MIKPLDYHKLQLRLLKKARRKAFPLKAMFELTYRCNLRCRHCYVVPPGGATQTCTDEKHGLAQMKNTDEHRWKTQVNTDRNDSQNELNTKEVFIILEQLAAAGCLNLGFTGGEPFLRRDIFEILGYAKKKGFNIIVLTNGTLITPKKADKLKEIGLNKIDVSFHTTDKEIFDWFTKAPGTYRRVLRAVKLLRDRGIEVYLKTTAMTINKDDMVKIRHLAVEKFGAHFRWGPTVTPAWDRKKENLQFRLKPDEINYLLKEIHNDTEIELEKLDTLEKNKKRRLKKQKIRRRKINHNRLFRCGAGRTEVTINPYGEMKLCMDIPEPKYQILNGSFAPLEKAKATEEKGGRNRENSLTGFTEGWKMLSDYVKNTPPGPSYQCRDCELAQYCNFCPARGWLECGDMSACPPYYKEMAELARMEAEEEVASNE